MCDGRISPLLLITLLRRIWFLFKCRWMWRINWLRRWENYSMLPSSGCWQDIWNSTENLRYGRIATRLGLIWGKVYQISGWCRILWTSTQIWKEVTSLTVMKPATSTPHQSSPQVSAALRMRSVLALLLSVWNHLLSASENKFPGPDRNSISWSC